MAFKITYKTHIVCIIIAWGIGQAYRSTIDLIIENFMVQPFASLPTGNYLINFYIYLLVLVIILSAIHEFIHGISYRIFNGDVVYGFKFIYAYTREISERKFERNKFLIILMSPVVLISLLSLMLPYWVGGLVFLSNLLGAVGDIYMAFIISKCRHDARIIDRSYGFDVV